MAIRPASSSRRLTAIGLAVSLMLIGAGATVFVASQYSSSSSGQSGSSAPSGPIAPPEDIVKATDADSDFDAGLAEIWLLEAPERPGDPERVAGKIEWFSFDSPDQQTGLADITKPKVTLNLEDGRKLVLQSQFGQLRIPPRSQQPEAGRFYDDVVINVYAADENPDTAEPELVGNFESLTFDRTSNEVITDEAFVVTMARGTFEAPNMRMQWNQIRNRIEYFAVQGAGRMTYATTARDDSQDSDGRTAADRPSERSAVARNNNEPNVSPPTPTGSTEPATVDETTYAAQFARAVRVSRGDSTIDSDTLWVWARVIDSALPDGAIAPMELAFDEQLEDRPELNEDTDAASGSDAEPALASNNPPSGAPARPASTPADDEPVVLTWTGSLVLTPTSDAPMLDEDDVAVRFVGQQPGAVVGRTPAGDDDDDTTIELRCNQIDYRATTRRVALLGHTDRQISLAVGDDTRARFDRADADLSIARVDIDSAGQIEFARPGDEPRRIVWSRSARFDGQADDGVVTRLLARAVFDGDAEASEGEALLRGQTITASFFDQPADRPTLERVVADADVLTRDAKGSWAKGERVEIDFAKLDVAPDQDAEDDTSTPTFVRFDGAFEGLLFDSRGRHHTLRAETLETSLLRNDAGDVEADQLRATGSARYENKSSDVYALADELRLDAPARIADLIGDGRDITIQRGLTRIRGRQARLDENLRRIDVFEAGRFEHGTPDAAATALTPSDPADRQVTAEWSDAMSFQDAGEDGSPGTIECSGDVDARVQIFEPDEIRRDQYVADRMKLTFVPTDDAPQSADPTEGMLGADRRLIEAHAYAEDIDGLANVQVEIYERSDESNAAAVGERRSIMSIWAPELVADETAGLFRAIGPGKSIVQDTQRARSTTTTPGAPLSTGPGTTLMDWKGGMRMTRADWIGSATRQVKIAHRPLDGGSLIQLEAERVRAAFQPDDSADLRAGALRWAEAEGIVYGNAISNGPEGQEQRELLAHKLRYDPRTGMLVATPGEFSPVILLDEQTGSPLTLEGGLEWNMITGELLLRRPGVIASPSP